jgi:hypothetical protein
MIDIPLVYATIDIFMYIFISMWVDNIKREICAVVVKEYYIVYNVENAFRNRDE